MMLQLLEICFSKDGLPNKNKTYIDSFSVKFLMLEIVKYILNVFDVKIYYSPFHKFLGNQRDFEFSNASS